MKRTEKALAVLAAGGEFVQRLERNSYTGREQWAYRLKEVSGSTVRGIGFATFSELRSKLVSGHRTSVSTYYKLA
jgi:hypothetical protein